jgi:Family of unknown function (DUF6941)
LATRRHPQPSTVPNDRPEIDFLILADRAEGINGKLYMMGGGWQEIRVRDFAQPLAFSIAVGVLVPWNATNEQLSLEVRIESDDGQTIPPSIPIGLNVGRPPNSVPGQEFRSMIAINGNWKFEGPGTYRAIASIGEDASRKTTFRTLLASTPA